MALLHMANLVPSKLEILAGWLPGQPWYPGGGLAPVGSFRLDDPAGEVGVEFMLVRTDDGTVLHVPCTYRGAEAPDLAHALMGTTEHSVLGARWFYDADADPVYQAVIRQAILTGATQAAEEVHHPDGTVAPRASTVHARGIPGDRAADDAVVRTVRLPHLPDPGIPALVAAWDGQDEPLVVAFLEP